MITLGEYSYNATNDIDCYIDTTLTIGKFCSIGSGLKIISGQHPPVEYPACVSQFPFKEQWGVNYLPCKMSGEVTIGNDVWVGTDVTILDGVTVGDGCIIGAKSVVASSVEPYRVIVGNPARIASVRFEAAVIKKLLEIQWWNWPGDKIKEAMPYMKDIYEFIEKYG